MIIILISIFKENYLSSMTANLPYGPPVNTDIDFYGTFLRLFLDTVSFALLVLR